jgi:hydroxymethylglutaryl-CoA reductase
VGADPVMLDLADVMVESAVGVMPVPLGVATGVLIDGRTVDVPLAVEEPSVVAALSYAGRLLRAGGGIHTWASDPVMTAQVFVSQAGRRGIEVLESRRDEIASVVDSRLGSLVARGGGFRDLDILALPRTGLLRLHLHVDVRDAMGANVLNTATEALRSHLEEWTGGRVLMCILSNSARRRSAGAEFAVPLTSLRAEGLGRRELAERIVLASDLAQEDADRAVTHNKGIMNGISSLALATGNDTRAVEAAAHAWAARDGLYRGLSQYRLEGEELSGRLEMPLPVATVGGAVSVHPAARLALAVLGHPNATELSRIAVAVGLVQNFAALRALVSEGIQKGHMHHHAARLAFQVGARGAEIQRVVEGLTAAGTYSLDAAGLLLSRERQEHRG